MGEVVPLRAQPKREKRAKPHPMPERLSLAQIERLHRRAARWRFTMQEVTFATITVRAWAEGRGSTADRADWVAVIFNALRLGWGLRGFDRWMKRRGREGWRGDPITRARLDTLLEKLRALGYE